MKQKKFIKNKEDFICENCGEQVIGNGYTNHCPKCLWSKHVDIYPGDRASECRGMMDSVNIEIKGVEHLITHRCEKCGYEKINQAAPQDNFDEIIWNASN